MKRLTAALFSLFSRTAEMRLAVRITVAGIVSYLLAAALGLTQGYWAVFTAVIVMQASVGGSLKATLDRLIGTLGGAVYGGAVAFFVPHGNATGTALALAIALLPLGFVAAIDARFRVAPVTAVIVLISPFGNVSSPIWFTLDRILEIALGSAVALAVSLLVLPARAHGLLAETAGKLVGGMADFLGVILAGATSPTDAGELRRLQIATRRLLGQLETVAEDARRERDSFLTEDADPDPIVRTSMRLRNDMIMVARAIAEPLPQTLAADLASPIQGVAAAGIAFFRGLGEAFQTRTRPPSLEDFDAAIRIWREIVTKLRESGVLRSQPVETRDRVFALGFALTQLRADASDLVNRAAEFAREEPVPGTTL